MLQLDNIEEVIISSLHFIKHFVHLRPSNQMPVKIEKLLKGELVWVDGLILKINKDKLSLIVGFKFFMKSIMINHFLFQKAPSFKHQKQKQLLNILKEIFVHNFAKQRSLKLLNTILKCTE